MFRLIVLFAALATINAQYLAPAITSQQNNIYRSFGNLGQVATQSKTINTPFSSVSKSDVRVSNPGVLSAGYGGVYGGYGGYGAVPAVGYGAVPAVGYGAVPAIGYGAGYGAIARPAVVARPAVAAVPGVGLLGVAYSAAPTVAHMSYSNALGLNYAW
ncbi:cuticle protein 76-like [Contarinia nasturtii]|uniref:cuticle protein 76-like n=1 Tax=Contarinia nasturtii TaxID=265458 RepID=UPI0012D373B3|nr:cuticle protein 76-like [Contarinia nasturtii]